MLFCPANQTFDVPWIHHGMNMCNIETVSSVFLASYLLIFGFGQFWYYRKYAAPITEAVNAAPRRKLYSLQKFLLVFVPMLATVRVILKAYFYEDAALYGFMVSSTLLFLRRLHNPLTPVRISAVVSGADMVFLPHSLVLDQTRALQSAALSASPRTPDCLADLLHSGICCGEPFLHECSKRRLVVPLQEVRRLGNYLISARRSLIAPLSAAVATHIVVGHPELSLGSRFGSAPIPR